MEYINVTKENLENEHICCAISNNKDVQVSSQKTWLSDRMDDGLVFLGEAIMQWQFGWYREIKASSSQRDVLAIFIFRKKERTNEKSI